MSLSPQRLVTVMSEAMQLVNQLPEGDLRLTHDSLEGETRFFAVLDDYAEAALADTRLIEAAEARVKRIKERAARHRDIVLRMLDGVGLKSAERPLYTAAITYRAKLNEPDMSVLPAEFVRLSPDKAMIARALRRGEEVPGAAFGNTAPSLLLKSDRPTTDADTDADTEDSP